MKKGTSIRLKLLCAVLGLLLTSSLCLAQGKAGPWPPHRQMGVQSQATIQGDQTRAAVALNYTFTIVNFPGAPETVAYGINPSGTPSALHMAGANGAVGSDGYGSGFLLQMTNARGIFSETLQTVNFPTGTGQQANSTNDPGQIVGTYFDGLGTEHGYELSNGSYTTIDAPFQGVTYTVAYGINNTGTIVGCFGQAGNDGHGFVLSRGNYVQLDFPGDGILGTCANGINNQGDIVGWYDDAANVTHGFLLRGGTYTSLDPPGSTSTAAGGINDGGEIVGYYCLTSACSQNALDGAQGFLLSKGNFANIDAPDASGTLSFGISNNNVIVGWYTDCAGLYHSFIATLPGTP